MSTIWAAFILLARLALAAPEPPKRDLGFPEGVSGGDLFLLFVDDGAPALASFEGCDEKLFKAASPTGLITEEERNRTARRIVRENRAEAHWCFFGQLVMLVSARLTGNSVDPAIGEDPFRSSRQVVTTFRYLSKLAKAFYEEHQEPRYLMIAGTLFRELSQMEFKRFLEYSPEFTKLMVDYYRRQRPEIHSTLGPKEN